MDTTPRGGSPSRRQLLTYAGAAAGAAALGGIGLSATPAFAAPSFVFPLEFKVDPLSGFGYRTDPYTGQNALHDGADYPAATGTRIHAIASGTVSAVTGPEGYGNVTFVDHGGGFVSFYGHQSKIAVQVGQKVGAGQYIGLVGSTGWSTGPHLHLGLHVNDKATDPVPYVQDRPVSPEGTGPVSAVQSDDDFTLISSPGRGAAVIGAGYFRALPTDEFVACARALLGDPHEGNDRQFDVWKSIALSGTRA